MRYQTNLFFPLFQNGIIKLLRVQCTYILYGVFVECCIGVE